MNAKTVVFILVIGLGAYAAYKYAQSLKKKPGAGRSLDPNAPTATSGEPSGVPEFTPTGIPNRLDQIYAGLPADEVPGSVAAGVKALTYQPAFGADENETQGDESLMEIY